jgi:hypothetical protein
MTGIQLGKHINGDPGGSRTPNPQIRSLMLYPVELRGRERTVEWVATPEGIMPHPALAGEISKKSGVGNGNRTRNRRSHSPVLYQLSYSHHRIRL